MRAPNRTCFVSFFGFYFWLIWARLDFDLGSILIQFFGLGSLLDTHLYKKRGCSRKCLNEKSTFLPPRRLGNRPQIAPRRLQEVTFSLLNLHLFFWSIFGSHLDPQKCNNPQKVWFCRVPKTHSAKRHLPRTPEVWFCHYLLHFSKVAGVPKRSTLSIFRDPILTPNNQNRGFGEASKKRPKT